MPVPPKEEQTKIVKLVSAVDSIINALSHILCAYETLKKSLLHDLLTGHVRVNPALLEQSGVAHETSTNSDIG